ncbi:MAG TPA: LacI family DNA-binding transcriptional regulator, partial [Devosia sp.]
MNEALTRPKRGRSRQEGSTARRVTMTDIARAAGCSQATVSFVLNRTPGIMISLQTR